MSVCEYTHTYVHVSVYNCVCRTHAYLVSTASTQRSFWPPRTYLHNLNCQQVIRNCRPNIFIIFQLTHTHTHSHTHTQSPSSNAVDTLISSWSRPHSHSHSPHTHIHLWDNCSFVCVHKAQSCQRMCLSCNYQDSLVESGEFRTNCNYAILHIRWQT